MAPGWWFPLEPLRCRTWTDDALREQKSKTPDFSVHVSETPSGNFHNVLHGFFNLMHSWISYNEAKGRDFCTTDLSTIKRKKRSNLEVMGLSEDFSLPPDLQIHSVVLRIASTGLCMWLHYDVCDNFRCCIRGCKRVVLLSLSSS